MTGFDFELEVVCVVLLCSNMLLLSVRTFNSFVRGSKDNTTLEAKLTSAMLRNGCFQSEISLN